MQTEQEQLEQINKDTPILERDLEEEKQQEALLKEELLGLSSVADQRVCTSISPLSLHRKGARNRWIKGGFKRCVLLTLLAFC